jgi:putative transcriptional regulator
MIVCTLKRVLEKKGWTRYRLQKATGIAYPTLHALYHNRTYRYSAPVLDKLCRTLECQPGDLVKWNSNPYRFPREKNKS